MASMVDPTTGQVFRFVSRSEWGARPPRWQNAMRRYDGCYSHHGVSRQQPAVSIWRGYQNWHMDGNGWPDIGYSYGYDDQGVIYEGRGFLIAGAHTFGFNEVSNGFCYIGDSDKVPPPPAAVKALYCLIRNAETVHGRTGYVRDHREGGQISGSATSCPGGGLYGVAAKVREVPAPPRPEVKKMREIWVDPYTGTHWLVSGVERRALREQNQIDAQRFMGTPVFATNDPNAMPGYKAYIQSFEDVNNYIRR